MRGLREISRALKIESARVVKWQTRTFEGRMPKGMRVQVPPRAPSIRFCVHLVEYLSTFGMSNVQNDRNFMRNAIA
jgi:hypothetical protein